MLFPEQGADYIDPKSLVENAMSVASRFLGVFAARAFVGWGCALAAVVLAIPASASAFPDRPVKLIVPWPAGGSTDVALRALAQATAPHLGQPIVVENRPGVAGTLGPATMAKSAKPDGYTLTQYSIALIRVAHMQEVTYNPVSDFTPIIGLSGYTFGVVVRADSPWRSWDEFVAHSKAHPGKISYGSVGTGSSQHIAMEAIAEKVGATWLHVPFKGSSDALTALMGGHVDAASDSTGWAPHVNAGRLRLLVTFGKERTKKWATVPTLLDKGYGLVFESPFGLAGPAGMPPEVVRVLHDAFKKGLESPEFQKTLENLDQSKVYEDTESYRRSIETMNKVEGALLKRLGLSNK